MIHDEIWMQRALALAERGRWTTSPNPRVGCVIVQSGAVVGEGWHEKAGEPHAEVFALQQAGERAKGATVYVTLEPCSHFGKTPPCADALIQAGVSRVVIAMKDPNPKVAGNGINRLKAANIAVEVGLFEEDAYRLNRGFILRMTQQRPLITLKLAASLDGKIALSNGKSQWITGERARHDVQQFRATQCGILTTIATASRDLARLTVREVKCDRAPVRLVLDSTGSADSNLPIFSNEARTVLIVGEHAVISTEIWQEKGVDIWRLPLDSMGRIELNALMSAMNSAQLNEVMTEAGAVLNGALLTSGFADCLRLYLAPKLFGSGAQSLLQVPDFKEISDSFSLKMHKIFSLGDDVCIEADILRKV